MSGCGSTGNERSRDAAGARDHPRGGVHDQVAHFEHGRALGGAATEERAHPRDELAEIERLDQVVVGARVEAADFVDLLASRRQHDDGHERVPTAKILADLVAVHVRQHEVEQDGVRLFVLRQRDAVPPLARRSDAKPLELERVLQTEHDVRFVFDDEDRLFGGHRRRPSCPFFIP